MQFPINLNLVGRTVLVVGAGRIATRKAQQLVPCGADITVIAPHVVPEMRDLPVTILERKYGLDDFNQAVFAGGAVRVGNGLWKWGDRKLIDGLLVNGTAGLVGWVAGVVRWFQTGFIYSYAFSMIFGVMVLLTLFAFYVHR